MTIRESLQLVINQILVERNSTGHSPTAREVQRRAVAAIIAGQRNASNQISDEWRDYMNYLLTATKPVGTPADPGELARLLPTDGSTQDDRQQERAYLTANGMCGTPTTDALLDGNTTDALDRQP